MITIHYITTKSFLCIKRGFHLCEKLMCVHVKENRDTSHMADEGLTKAQTTVFLKSLSLWLSSELHRRLDFQNIQRTSQKRKRKKHIKSLNLHCSTVWSLVVVADIKAWSTKTRVHLHISRRTYIYGKSTHVVKHHPLLIKM